MLASREVCDSDASSLQSLWASDSASSSIISVALLGEVRESTVCVWTLLGASVYLSLKWHSCLLLWGSAYQLNDHVKKSCVPLWQGQALSVPTQRYP